MIYIPDARNVFPVISGLNFWAAGSNIKSGVDTKRCLATLVCMLRSTSCKTYADNQHSYSTIFPEDTTTSSFLNLIHKWWLVVNAKERFHPDVIGSALTSSDGKIKFLNLFANWLSD